MTSLMKSPLSLLFICILKSEFPQERLCPPNKEGLPRKIPNFCRKRHNGVEMEKHSCEECVSGFQRIRLQTPVIAVNYFLATKMTFLKIETQPWNGMLPNNSSWQLNGLSVAQKNDNQKEMRCFVVEEFEQIVSSGGRYNKFLIFEPLSIHCIGHTRREGNGWFWDLASILGNRATSTWQPISLLFFQWSFVFENYICIEISCLSFKSPCSYMYLYFNFWEFLSLYNDTNWVKY